MDTFADDALVVVQFPIDEGDQSLALLNFSVVQSALKSVGLCCFWAAMSSWGVFSACNFSNKCSMEQS